MKTEFAVISETDKAVQVETFAGHFNHQSRYLWIPKSICKFETYVATLNQATNEPETYGKRVVEVADWFCNKNLKG